MQNHEFSLGPLMRRNGDRFFNLLKERCEIANARERPFVYLEIGILSGDTLLGACQAAGQWAHQWKAYGVDLWHGPWIKEADWDAQVPTLEAKIGKYLSVMSRVPEEHHWHKSGCGIYLIGNENFLDHTDELFDFVFLDACHEYDCCKRDFLGVEPKVTSGGVVAIHDTNPDIQGGDFQQHRGLALEVRKMVQDVGLLNNTRPGWRLLDDLIHPPHTDRGCVFVQKV